MYLISLQVISYTPFMNSELYEFAKSYIYKYTPLHFIFPYQTIRIQTGSNASSIRRMKNLKSCPCEECLHLPDFDNSVVEPLQRKENTIDVQSHCGIVTCVKHTAFFLNRYADCSLSPWVSRGQVSWSKALRIISMYVLSRIYVYPYWVLTL